ncbi:MAG: bifunctional diaminohydroxyphosphoribosylaminopyrimidine deaminase/5-amino-6-(5-phosphoribosylamino)uracil reductase RibD [Bacteroidia bacterium]|nr:bifunctional diaminohydroxyphosphoribosylaminopyrimidine deaminase/5-amino-6-(5-phosphoribosylamino)uracil reductase RibD [Bacteroidia bacterium]
MKPHEVYIKRCFELARLAGKKTGNNPMVGAVLVYKDKIIGEGYHRNFGGPHAEVNAIHSVPVNLKVYIPESILYISLEPCCIHGKTPACSDLIMKSGIKKVVVSTMDPNPRVSGKSLDLLQKNGIETISGVLQRKGKDLIRPFKAHLGKRPYITLKFAQSSDGYFGKRGKQIWISNKYSKMKVHQWRAENDGILIGFETARIDNPKLTTRLVKGDSPVRIVLDENLELDRSHHLWSDEHDTIFVSSMQNSDSIHRNKQFLDVKRDEKFLANLLFSLFDRGINYLLVEGGAKTIKAFVEHNLWDEARIIRTDKTLGGGIRAPFIPGQVFKTENLLSDRIEYLYPH